MSAYIKDMKIPNRCGECKIGFCEQIGCYLYIGFGESHIKRHPNCPLIEVPEHGRLIDADALKAGTCFSILHIEEDECGQMHGWRELSSLDNAPTVIPASKDADCKI